jgi:leader peptidase (prepilin peptidase) / N-methyltransferase
MIDSQLVLIIFIFIFGSVMGSFYNVVIYRIPIGKSILYPPSACPGCGQEIKFYDNIPIISYILLMGKCRKCSSKIPIGYPLIELLTAIIAVALYFKNGFNLNLITDFILSSILLTSAFIDFKHMIIPNKLTYTGAVIGIAFSVFRGSGWIIRATTGAAVGFAIIMFMLLLGRILYKRDGVGYGDVKLAMVIGIFTGPLWCFLSMVTAILIGGVWGIFQILIGQKIKNREMPFGPFIALGAFFILFFDQKILYLLSKYLN